MVKAGARSGQAVAALPMYDWPEVRAATDSLWRSLASSLRARGFPAPESLDRGRPDGAIWRDSDLLIAQTCGYPFVTALHGKVRIVATPAYDADGCTGPLYCSHIVVRAGEPVDELRMLEGRTVAINSMCSQSGFAALHHAVRGLDGPSPFFASAEFTGGHRESMQAVAGGTADVAAIDAVCWAMARRYRPDLAARLRSIGTTGATPGLPFVTARSRPEDDVALIAEALEDCFTDPGTADARERLFLKNVERLPEDDYLAAYSRLADADRARLMSKACRA